MKLMEIGTRWSIYLNKQETLTLSPDADGTGIGFGIERSRTVTGALGQAG
jgi:hypothetical protein